MRIIFFGIPDLGVVCLNGLVRSKKNIVAVVPPHAGHPARGMMIDIASSFGLPGETFDKSPKEPDFIERVRALKPDVAFVCAFDNRLPPELLSIPKLGFINCHPSILPEYRGGIPYFHTLVNGDKHTGITFHYMDENFDTGDIITQWKTEVHPTETMGTLFSKLNAQSAGMLVEIADKLERGETLPRIPQDKGNNFKTAPNIYQEKGDTLIDWSKDARHVDRFVRACNPFFGAMTYFRGCLMKIWSGREVWQFHAGKSEKYHPGTIVKVSSDEFAIITGDGLFYPSAIQAGNLFITDARDFIARTQPKKGEMFSSLDISL